MSNFSLFPENLLLTWNEKPIVAKRFLMSQLKRLALETCQLAGKHAGKHDWDIRRKVRAWVDEAAREL